MSDDLQASSLPDPVLESVPVSEPSVVEAVVEPALEPLPIVDQPDSPPEEISKQKANWTPERRAALSAKMKEKHAEKSATPSPFALSEDHEFPTSSTRPAAVTASSSATSLAIPPAAAADLSSSIPPDPPPLPGTPASPFRRCSCLGVLPGRCCTFCYGTKWIKLCPKCEGEGRISLTVRKGAERSQPCGHCGGRGTLPVNLKEVNEATQLAEEFVAGEDGKGKVEIIATAEPEFRRAVRLPGIGATAKKRGGTLMARRRDKARNENRVKQYKGARGKTAAATAKAS